MMAVVIAIIIIIDIINIVIVTIIIIKYHVLKLKFPYSWIKLWFLHMKPYFYGYCYF